MKKILKSLFVFSAVALVAVFATRAYFNDTEASTNNVFTAGSIDLKIDHVRQVYNDVDCQTCSVVLVSDTSNIVVAKNGSPVSSPYPAVFGWVHPLWTAQNDTELLASNAKWIWEANPTKQEDTTVDVTYTFKKTFEWLGPVTSSDLFMAVGHDNTVEVWLNGYMIGSSDNIYGWRIGDMLHIPAANITPRIIQGNNEMLFVVKNVGQSNGNPTNNPAGLIYKFAIDGRCDNDFFRNQCRLWQEKDLVGGDIFYNFDDIKPGDSGLNVISLHVYDNDAYACLNNRIDSSTDEGVNDPESDDDTTDGNVGDLESDLVFFAWHDSNGDGKFDDGEVPITPSPMLGSQFLANPQSLFVPSTVLPADTTQYLAIAWCMGAMSSPTAGEEFVCDGSGVNNRSQTDKLMTTLSFYVEQARHNEGFSCTTPEESLTDGNSIE